MLVFVDGGAQSQDGADFGLTNKLLRDYTYALSRVRAELGWSVVAPAAVGQNQDADLDARIGAEVGR